MRSDPVQGVLDRQPAFAPRIHRLIGGERIRSPGGTIQSRIRQTQTLGNHRLLRIRSGQLRDGIDLIETQLTGSEFLLKQRQILQPPRHPDQLSGSRMPKPKSRRNPFRKRPSPIRQEPLTPICIDQPITDLRIENRQTREQMTQDPIGLVIGEILPLHESQRIRSQ